MYKILLLTDFSAASKHAIAFAQALFADTATEFCLLNTFAIEPVDSYGGTAFLSEKREQAQKALLSLQRALAQKSTLDAHFHRALVMLGGAVEAVELVLAREHFDLVVVGATGAGNHEVFGSVATGLVRTAKTNVLVVPASAAIRPVDWIVLATDYRSVNRAESLTFLKELTARKAAQLLLLTIENPDQPNRRASEPSRQYVRRIFGKLPIETCTIEDRDVRHGINTYLDTQPVDLLVLLPHHKSIFDLVRHRSLTRSVAYQPPVALLSLYDDIDPDTPAAEDAPDLDSIPFATYL